LCSSLAGKQSQTAAVQTEALFTADFVYGLDAVYHEIRATMQDALAKADHEKLPHSMPFHVESPAPPDAHLFSLLNTRSQLCSERLRSLLRADLRHLSGVQWPGRGLLASRMATPEPIPTKILLPSGWAKLHARMPAIAAPAAQQIKPNQVQMDASSLIPESAAHSPTKFVRALTAARRSSFSDVPTCQSPDAEAVASNKLPALAQFKSLARLSLTSLSTNKESEKSDVSGIPSVTGNSVQCRGLLSSRSSPVLSGWASRSATEAEELFDREEVSSPKLNKVHKVHEGQRTYFNKSTRTPTVQVSSQPLF
jgi:hypothetical protein